MGSLFSASASSWARTQSGNFSERALTVEIGLAIGGLAALLWAAVVMLRGGLVGGALLVLLAGSCFGFAFFNLPAGPLPLTLDRLLLVALVVQCAIYRRWGWINPPRLTKTDFVLAAFLGLLAISTFTHDFTYHNKLPAAQLVFFFLLPAALYWVVRQADWTDRSSTWLFASLALFGGYLCLTAVAETHQMWWLVVPTYIGSAAYPEFLGRGRGPYLNPIANGMMLALCMSAVLMFWPRITRPMKLLLLAALPAFAWGLYCTLTRSVWIGAAVALVAVLGLSTPRVWRGAVLAVAALVAAVGIGVGWEHFSAFKRDQFVSVEEVAESAKLRPILAVVAWHMFLDRPLLGCGFGQYIQEAPAYLSDRTTDLPLEKARPYIQHNAFLALLVETGAVGLALFLALITGWSLAAWRLWQNVFAPLWARQIGLLFLAFMGTWVANAMFHNVLIISMVNMVMFFLAGSVMALAARWQGPEAYERPRLWVAEPELWLLTS